MKVIDEIFAFVSDDESNDTEGIVTIHMHNFVFPLVCSREILLEAMKSQARIAGKKSGHPITIKKFKLVSQEILT